MSAPAPILWDVLEEHLDEAEYLYEGFEEGLSAPDETLPELAGGLEARLHAHLDGLAIGGPAAVERLLQPVLQDPEAAPPRITVAAWATLQGGDTETYWQALLAAPPSLAPALGRALALAGPEPLRPRLAEAIGPSLAAALEAFLARAQGLEAELPNLLRRLEPEVHAAALALGRYAPASASSGFLERALGTGAGPIRSAAAETALVFGQSEALGVARAEPDLLDLLLLLGDRPSLERAYSGLPGPERRAHWLALGCSGRVDAVLWALEHLGLPEDHRLAAEAFQRITGIDYAQAGALLPPGPEPELPSLEEEVPLEALLPQVEDRLPSVDPDRVRAWWKAASGRFNPAHRYLQGQVLNAERLRDAFLTGPMRPRALWARELLVRSRGALAIPTGVGTALQRAALQRWPKALELEAPWTGGRA